MRWLILGAFGAAAYYLADGAANWREAMVLAALPLSTVLVAAFLGNE